MRVQVPPELARTQLAHVRWIGGGTGAGKSTVAARLAEGLGLRLYNCEPISAYVPRSNPVDDPLLHAFMAMDMDQRWLDRSPTVMLETFHGYQGEGFDLVVEDLLALPAESTVLAEGFRLLPRLIAPLLTRSNQAVWLIPTPEFRRTAFARRGSLWDIAGQTSDPPRALENLLTRDELFTQQVAEEARSLRLTTIAVDSQVSLDNLTDLVEEQLLRSR
jgi:hypothetical protein